VDRGKIAPDELDRALELQRERGDKLGKIVVDMGLIAHRDVLAALSDQLGLPLVTVDGPPPEAPEIEGLSHRSCGNARPIRWRWPIPAHRRHGGPAGFRDRGGAAGVFRSGNSDRAGLRQEILDAIDRHYGEAERETVGGAGDDEQANARPGTPARHGERSARHPPGERHDRSAIEIRASDIHIEPFERNSASATAWTACSTTRTRRRGN